MTTDRNDITGDPLVTKPATEKYRDGWDAIFGKNQKAKEYLEKTHDSFVETMKNIDSESEKGALAGKIKKK